MHKNYEKVMVPSQLGKSLASDGFEHVKVSIGDLFLVTGWSTTLQTAKLDRLQLSIHKKINAMFSLIRFFAAL